MPRGKDQANIEGAGDVEDAERRGVEDTGVDGSDDAEGTMEAQLGSSVALSRAVGKRFRGYRAKRLYVYEEVHPVVTALPRDDA